MNCWPRRCCWRRGFFKKVKMKEKLFSKIMVEIKGGAIVNVVDLPEDHYEQFLETMHQVRIAYIAATSR